MDWEPSYGFCAYNNTDNEVMANTLEAIRRRICAYGGADTCDCKYGLRAEGTQADWITDRPVQWHSEQTGCPELREMIHRLLHRDDNA